MYLFLGECLAREYDVTLETGEAGVAGRRRLRGKVGGVRTGAFIYNASVQFRSRINGTFLLRRIDIVMRQLAEFIVNIWAVVGLAMFVALLIRTIVSAENTQKIRSQCVLGINA